MFENLFKTLETLEGESTYTLGIECDEKGYIDKECPNRECMSKFKISGKDWEERISKDRVFCPFCGHTAPADSWWTTEQVNQAEEQAIQNISAMLNSSIKKDVEHFNRSFPKSGFVKINMKFSGSTYVPVLPARALEEMKQEILCEKCGTHYAVIGSAFYCPCCGHNSAKQTFFNSIDKVKAKVNNLDMVRNAITEISKDDAARTCESLIESSVSDLVVAFQRVCECVYTQMPNSKKNIPKNTFQRLVEGSSLWNELVGLGYEDWLSKDEYFTLKKCFQQRHLLQHKEGVVDQEYIDKSGDYSYKVGQRIILKEKDVFDYTNIVEKIGRIILGLLAPLY